MSDEADGRAFAQSGAPVRVAFATIGDPEDRRTWSGSPFFMVRSLREAGAEVTALGPYRSFAEVSRRAAARVSNSLFRRSYLHRQSLAVARSFSAQTAAHVAGGRFDVVFAAASSATVAFFESPLPLVYASDTTFALMRDYYPSFSRLWGRSAREADEVERRAIQRADHLLYPTEWAARSAMQDYGADPRKVTIAPFGANLESPPLRDRASARSLSIPCRLLFIGVDWERKGGPVAFEALEALVARGIDARLVVVGCTPPGLSDHPRVRVIPYLNKQDPEQRAVLDELFYSAHFLIVPTRSDCFGVVFSEASAFGLPSLATRTGGVAEAVRHGVNGLALPLEANGNAYATLIERFYKDAAAYGELVKGALRESETRLSWTQWATAALGAIGSARGRPTPWGGQAASSHSSVD